MRCVLPPVIEDNLAKSVLIVVSSSGWASAREPDGGDKSGGLRAIKERGRTSG